MQQRRSGLQKALDCITFPLRAISLFHDNRWGLSSLACERYDYTSREISGHCLDVGCGPNNRFITEFRGGDGIGIDVFPYEGLTSENLVEDISSFPFPDESFDSVTFIANLNHVPEKMRDIELAESYRVLRPGGNIIVTMGNPLAEILAHQAVAVYDKAFGTNHDLDGERGMTEGEEYYLRDREILRRLEEAGFVQIKKKYFWTQWALNHLMIGWKR